MHYLGGLKLIEISKKYMLIFNGDGGDRSKNGHGF